MRSRRFPAASFFSAAILDDACKFGPCRDRQRRLSRHFHCKPPPAECHPVKPCVPWIEIRRCKGRCTACVGGRPDDIAEAGAHPDLPACCAETSGARQIDTTGGLVATDSEQRIAARHAVKRNRSTLILPVGPCAGRHRPVAPVSARRRWCGSGDRRWLRWRHRRRSGSGRHAGGQKKHRRGEAQRGNRSAHQALMTEVGTALNPEFMRSGGARNDPVQFVPQHALGRKQFILILKAKKKTFRHAEIAGQAQV